MIYKVLLWLLIISLIFLIFIVIFNGYLIKKYDFRDIAKKKKQEIDKSMFMKVSEILLVISVVASFYYFPDIFKNVGISLIYLLFGNSDKLNNVIFTSVSILSLLYFSFVLSRIYINVMFYIFIKDTIDLIKNNTIRKYNVNDYNSVLTINDYLKEKSNLLNDSSYVCEYNGIIIGVIIPVEKRIYIGMNNNYDYIIEYLIKYSEENLKSLFEVIEGYVDFTIEVSGSNKHQTDILMKLKYVKDMKDNYWHKKM